MSETKDFVKGGEFLVREFSPSEVFIPEEFTEEQKMIGQTAEDFMEKEVMPYDEKIEKKDYELLKNLLRKAAELGFTGAEIPEKYGGLELDKVSTMILGEKLSMQSSFAITWGVQIGIGSLPIVYFGNEKQKSEYLPRVAAAEIFGAYALTEPCCGSDALALKTKAELIEENGEKYWLINGSKMFITNGGFADYFIVYARTYINGEEKGISAFIVPRNAEGFEVGNEFDKMGMRGSSTVPLFFENVKIPYENLIYEVGKGHYIAFGILNIGRYKLGASCIGSSKYAIRDAIKYGKERVAFGRPIVEFEMIREKIANVISGIYVGESAVYRTAGYMDKVLKGDLSGDESMKLIGEYAIEHSIIKIAGSEILDYTVDEVVQIYGGYGYTEEYPAARYYRDSRINRIWEGTNEINRQVIVAMIERKARKNQLPIIQKALEFANELISYMPETPGAGFLEAEKQMVDIFKKVFLMTAGLAVQKFGENLREKQIALETVANIVIETYLVESGLLRALKLKEMGDEKRANDAAELVKYYMFHAIKNVEKEATKLIVSAMEGDEQRMTLAALRKLFRWYEYPNYNELLNSIAQKAIDYEGYYMNVV